MDVTPLPTVTRVKDPQLWKALAPRLITLFGIVTDGKLAHPAKALSPIETTELAMVSEVREPRLWKAETPMLFTVLGTMM
jgi:beta-galactosidase/beta-glucuronidase